VPHHTGDVTAGVPCDSHTLSIPLSTHSFRQTLAASARTLLLSTHSFRQTLAASALTLPLSTHSSRQTLAASALTLPLNAHSFRQTLADTALTLQLNTHSSTQRSLFQADAGRLSPHSSTQRSLFHSALTLSLRGWQLQIMGCPAARYLPTGTKLHTQYTPKQAPPSKTLHSNAQVSVYTVYKD
jgi:hypothetical protein